ncbi:hypothetical protein A2334_00965 [Candidatus Roizmanbacteria bacterium RIFOXYB2_FULL_38_10]|uniref:Transcription regulator TrmB N-terminal domain-containing protein n=1 Tax=Candidatus Roizmanbacteria bacterium RIFOXYD1_FULL_38_12 TaxID=1802093 RepID=A0A1F7L1H7_9BACT|nr:MAG: hypothetical protein A3K47_04260 [Candidatus Roizmanbacteria bacterium RIFOXYA2_FULL_38_14]OGK63968.1 MAG: hypothetical protein A3K27_04260 [Candidatus Roizmanbacteria bacterium RIFOXYA1_FULL_37_12]OGK65814.1 MAG: hypothetical protein A3K38_04260 [Candidatus Roizmanbacteria bacterium RIFOXYB1_FULL_40_23]OGK68922.1 MAG: hypothetical protein A2334_00965 [Candidatus Roizmanbacteria bacterium RIFOXYB2_FULL_38_10]OGK70219.1 MAG: hypothetical protein A3K21_04265 [Candidatus Roizmanbacteria ba
MFNQTDNLINLLKPYGIAEEEAEIYLLLLEEGYLSALAISRKLHVGRTKVYRILDKLREKQLVAQKLDDLGLKFGTTSLLTLSQLLTRKEAELATLKNNLSTLLPQLEVVASHAKTKTKILYYSGKKGLEQVTYNSLSAKGTLRTIEVYKMTKFLDDNFSEKMRGLFAQRRIHVKQLSNVKEFKNWTKVKEFASTYWQARYIDPKDLRTTCEALIYNNVYALYNFTGRDVFCVEIYNEYLANMQKQIHEFMWNHAKKMKLLSPYGAAKVI